eukprot:gb/GECH01008517.1/.p1 GENE.gb/GECH01008517.1/~~gb/GECH01008517.1/.p1  ORF type:complete len:248 (+),score=37.13 gb/GECH01008517.1/:1-744(+)
MTLLQESERDKLSREDVRLSIMNQIFFIIGSLLLVIGSPLQIPSHYPRQRTVILIIGSSLFVAGSICSILGSCITFRWRPPSLFLLCSCSLLAGIFILMGSIFFLVGNCIAITGIPKFEKTGHIVWICGATCFIFGVSSHLFSDQLAIYRSSPNENRKYNVTNGLLMIGGDMYLIGSTVFLIGSSVLVAQPQSFRIMGQIMWCIGGCLFTAGASFKLASDVLKYGTTDYSKTSSLTDYNTLYNESGS